MDVHGINRLVKVQLKVDIFLLYGGAVPMNVHGISELLIIQMQLQIGFF